MRSRREIEERLHLLTQAFHFSYVHRKELSPDALAKHRALEESIGVLQWCLEIPDRRVSWQAVCEAFGAACRLFVLKLFGGGPEGKNDCTPESTETPATTPQEATR
ncbi:MAG: hypothetical protein QGI83_19390 [Candidatus Latescibacteria bacterium]|jgi:hypothetical protein|nr:hypothetical protein [Candidatus Latescibacterota bacterium]